MALQIDELICPQNHRCMLAKICPNQAISQVGFGLPVIDPNKCDECGECMNHCSMQAVRAMS